VAAVIVLLIVLRVADDHLRTKERQRRVAARRERQRRYWEYLRTPGWKSRRQVALQRASGRCRDCDRTTTQLEVHHLTYRRVGREHPKDLRALCPNCHEARHRGRRLSPLDRLIDWVLN
jgi:hypothetical protein